MKVGNSFALFGVLLITGALSAQDGPRGHWTGNIEVPGHSLGVEIDLDKTAGGWVGSISIPEQHASGLPLEAIAIADRKCSFRIKGGPGQPTFNGTLSADGKTLAGDFTQGGGTIPFSLSRTGDAMVEEVKKNPAVAKEFLGTWEGTLEGPSLRLVLKMANDASGANAVLVSVDQGGAEIPVTTIEQKETKLTLLVKAVGGEYQAELNKDGTELTGTWSQGGNDLPLKLKKKADAPAKP
jgi:hypothetical protein